MHCSTGAGDGRWVDVDHANVWSDFHFADEVHSETTFAGAPTTYNMFTITGSVRVSNLYGVVETIIANTSSDIHLSLFSAGGETDVTNNVGAPDIDTGSCRFIAGTEWGEYRCYNISLLRLVP